MTAQRRLLMIGAAGCAALSVVASADAEDVSDALAMDLDDECAGEDCSENLLQRRAKTFQAEVGVAQKTEQEQTSAEGWGGEGSWRSWSYGWTHPWSPTPNQANEDWNADDGNMWPDPNSGGGAPSGGGGAPSGGPSPWWGSPSPWGGAPSGGAPSGGAPSGGAPSGGAPSGGAPSGSWGAPGGAPSGGAPSGGAPSGGAPAPVPGDEKCAPLSDPRNKVCKEPIDWVFQDGKFSADAKTWFEDMVAITGVDYLHASKEDFQRLYFCSPPGGKACGTAPCSCSKPPCHGCFGGAPPRPKRPGCTDSSTGIECRPPKLPMDYNGMTWPMMTYPGSQEMHIFAIGDWGGMDGSLNPIEGRPDMVAYSWGKQKGPSAFPRTRWNRYHTVELCNHKNFVECYDTKGDTCPYSCGFVKGVDDQPQILVAKAMAQRAELNKPQYILNVGDNFYWGGIEKTCGTPMDEISYTAHHQFDQIFENIYKGAGIADAPWLSVLGNHDWGGRQFTNGWDQQIAYTWASLRWVMPAPYFMVQIEYPDQDFSVDVFLIDSNVHDAKSPALDPEHNICGSAHNPKDADCSAVGGPGSIETCPAFFKQLWEEQKAWLVKKLQASKATWQIMVTHFPCGEDGANQRFYHSLRTKYGLDLMVTGHRHDQELWLPTDTGRNHMGGLTCIVTGGGGGISSEATPDPLRKMDWYGEGQYGFYDITIRKFSMTVESINYNGKVLKTAEVSPFSR